MQVLLVCKVNLAGQEGKGDRERATRLEEDPCCSQQICETEVLGFPDGVCLFAWHVGQPPPVFSSQASHTQVRTDHLRATLSQRVLAPSNLPEARCFPNLEITWHGGKSTNMPDTCWSLSLY